MSFYIFAPGIFLAYWLLVLILRPDEANSRSITSFLAFFVGVPVSIVLYVCIGWLIYHWFF